MVTTTQINMFAILISFFYTPDFGFRCTRWRQPCL